MKNILDVEKSVYFCTERLRGTQSKLLTFVYKCMKKKEKNQCMVSEEESFVSSFYSVFKSNLNKWFDGETARLASKGKGDDNLHLFTDPAIIMGTAYCDDYTLNFNRHERVIDLVVNGEKNSPLWKDVIAQVPGRFAKYLSGKSDSFLYRVSTNTSEEKEFRIFVKVDDEVGFLCQITKFNEIDAWRAENFDLLICEFCE